MRVVAIVSLLSVFCGWVPFCVHAAGPAVPNSTLTAHDWSVNASPNLAGNPPNVKLVERFIASIENSVGEYSILGEEGGEYVCSFRFADLRRDGFLSLVAGIGVVDRPSCRGVEIIDKTVSGFELYSSGGDIGAGSDVSAKIRDLRHDGHLEFLLSSGLGSIPQRCSANWTAIYAWTGANYTDVSDRFKDFYRGRLQLLDKAIPALQPARGANGYALSDKECLEAEAAALQRFLGISSDAGIDQAVRLATSRDRAEREFATELLAKIGTPKAREYLAKLAGDQDWTVSTYARNALAPNAKRPKVADAFTRVN